jgi:hypothetical protein
VPSGGGPQASQGAGGRLKKYDGQHDGPAPGRAPGTAGTGVPARQMRSRHAARHGPGTRHGAGDAGSGTPRHGAGPVPARGRARSRHAARRTPPGHTGTGPARGRGRAGTAGRARHRERGNRCRARPARGPGHGSCARAGHGPVVAGIVPSRYTSLTWLEVHSAVDINQLSGLLVSFVRGLSCASRYVDET